METEISVLYCPECKADLEFLGDRFRCRNGHDFPVVNGVPRFVGSDKYVKSFSLEWLSNPVTQYDSEFPSRNNFEPEFIPVKNYTKDFDKEWKKHPFVSNWDIPNKSETYDTFYIKTGIRPEALKGKRVLEIGCGNGRFLDVLSKAGAVCFGVDLSYSVEAAYQNLKDMGNVFIFQGDLNHLPFRENSFDFVFSIGVLHHTPSVEKALKNISKLVKPGSMISVWVYGKQRNKNLGRFWWSILRFIPEKLLYQVSKSARWLYYIYRLPVIGYSRFFFPIAMNPDPKIRIQSTFDSYSPRFSHKTSYPELAGYFKNCGFEEIEIGIFPTSVRGIRSQLD